MCRLLRLLSVALPILTGACVEPDVMPPLARSAPELAEMRTQRRMAFEEHQAEFARLQSVSDRLRMGAAPLCPDPVPRYGWSVANAFSFKPEVRELANAEYLLGDALKILRVTPGGPAGRAGVLPGDSIVAADGDPLAGPGAERQFAALSDRAGHAGAPLRLDLRRAGRAVHAEATGRPACDMPAYLTGSEHINAGTDGKRIFVSEGMLRFTRDDDELALVVAHEMSHDIRRHVAIRGHGGASGTDVLSAIGLAYGRAAAGAKRSGRGPELEFDADYVSLYLLALSGFDITHAPDFWRHVATLRPGDIAESYTHPSTAQRFIAMDAAVGEIQRKQAQGLILRPEAN